MFHAFESSSTDSSDSSCSTKGSPSSKAMTRVGASQRPRPMSMNAVESLRNELIFKINFNTVAARLMVMSTSQVLKQIPMRVGHSRALDDAVACICSSPTSSIESSLASPNKLYANALVSLQQAVKDDNTATATETLAAATYAAHGYLVRFDMFADLCWQTSSDVRTFCRPRSSWMGRPCCWSHPNAAATRPISHHQRTGESDSED